MYETYYHKNKKFRVKSMPRIILILAKNCRKTMTSQPTTAWMLGIVQALKSTHFFTAVREFPLSTVILLATLTLSTKKSKGQHLYSIMMERAWRMESTRTLTSSSGENRTDSYSTFSYPCGGWFCFGIGAHSVPRSGDFSAQGSYYLDCCWKIGTKFFQSIGEFFEEWWKTHPLLFETDPTLQQTMRVFTCQRL